jgi:hypothetical protein
LEADRLENQRLKYLENKILSSCSYRLGRAITWFPRKIIGCFRSIKEHGFWYTVKLVSKKIASFH